MGDDVGVVLEKISRIRDDIAEIKTAVDDLSDGQEAFVRKSIEEHTILGESAKKHDLTIIVHEKRITNLEQAIQPLIVMNKIVAAVGSILVVTIVAFVWALITHQVNVVPGVVVP